MPIHFVNPDSALFRRQLSAGARPRKLPGYEPVGARIKIYLIDLRGGPTIRKYVGELLLHLMFWRFPPV